MFEMGQPISEADQKWSAFLFTFAATHLPRLSMKRTWQVFLFGGKESIVTFVI